MMHGDPIQESRLPNLQLNGVGRAAGGHYGKARIDGVARVTGDLNCAVALRASGVVTIEGSVETRDMEIDGKLMIEGGLKAGNARLNGLTAVAGPAAAEQFRSNGVLTVDGTLEAERFAVQGAFKIGGLLNAGTIELKMTHMISKAGEIGGESVRVVRLGASRWRRLWAWAIPGGEPRLEVGVIEGDEVSLEYTHADVVRGGRIVIGQGCRIGRVEYRDELVVDPRATVEKEERSHG